MSCRRGVAAGVLAALQVIGGTDTVAGQSADPPEQDCDDRAFLRISVVDESGFISIPEATVVLRWTDAVRRPVREAAGPDGRGHRAPQPRPDHAHGRRYPGDTPG